MFKRVSQMAFTVLFLLMIVIPLLTTNLQKNKVSADENRMLAPRAELYKEDGTWNENYTEDFETWINDNIGMRSSMIINNARMQYYWFKVLANNADMYLGPNGELNYATAAMLTDYQHDNLYSDDYLHEIADNMQYLSDYVEAKGTQFYYYQCWDKHSIYPEYFPATVIQTGKESKTDGIVRALNDYSDVNVISPKQELQDGKSIIPTYSVWGDPAHWNQRGAYTGYIKLMNTINKNSDIQYRVLQESDYNITTPDQGATLFGGIHRVDNIEDFEIKNAKAILTNEKLTLYSDDERHRFFTNNEVDNGTRLLIIGDSYFDAFIIDDLAESFYETIIIWGDYLSNLQNIIDTYDADIVIVEAAERVDRTKSIINGVTAMKTAGIPEISCADHAAGIDPEYSS